MPEVIHHGHQITVADDLTFRVDGPQFAEKAGSFASARQAKDEIESRIAAAQKEHVATQRVSIPMLNAHGKAIIVRGVNRNDASVLGHEKEEGYASRLALAEIFPAVPWVEAALKQRAELLAQAAALTRQVWKYGIKASRGYGRIAADKYDRTHDDLVAEIEKKTSEAAAAATPINDAV